MLDYIKWSAKALVALVVPLIVTLIETNQDAIVDWAAGAVGAVITAGLVWLTRNGPQPD